MACSCSSVNSSSLSSISAHSSRSCSMRDDRYRLRGRSESRASIASVACRSAFRRLSAFLCLFLGCGGACSSVSPRLFAFLSLLLLGCGGACSSACWELFAFLWLLLGHGGGPVLGFLPRAICSTQKKLHRRFNQFIQYETCTEIHKSDRSRTLRTDSPCRRRRRSRFLSIGLLAGRGVAR